MSVKTQIERIKQSKANIISSLKAKGIAVPANASIDDLSVLVDAIEEVDVTDDGNGNVTITSSSVTAS